jgi:RND family efflux transporter MFP subunit
MKQKYSILTLLAGVICSAGSFAATELPTHKVVLEDVPTIYMLDGVVEVEQKTTISAQTSGTVKKVYYDVNDVVEKNAIVVRIDDTQQNSALKQALASEKEAAARVTEAQAEFDRIKEVYAKKVVSKADFDKVSAALSSAKARLEAAEAQVSQAEEQLEYTIVRAPFSGIMTVRHIEIGEAVNPGAPLVTGISLERLRVITHVPQSIINDVREHRFAMIIADHHRVASNDMTFFPFADPVTHTFQLRVHLPQNETILLPGMFVKVAMEVDREDKVVIPFQAVAFRGEVTGVYVLKEEKLYFRHVRLGRKLERQDIVVLAGISAGETIVTDPVAAAIAIKNTKTQ